MHILVPLDIAEFDGFNGHLEVLAEFGRRSRYGKNYRPKLRLLWRVGKFYQTWRREERAILMAFTADTRTEQVMIEMDDSFQVAGLSAEMPGSQDVSPWRCSGGRG